MSVSDLESGKTSAPAVSPAQQKSKEQEPGQQGERALLEAARKFNNDGRFIFKNFSETSIYILLHLQDDITRLQEEMRQKVAQGRYTVDERDVLMTSLKQYCNSRVSLIH